MRSQRPPHVLRSIPLLRHPFQPFRGPTATIGLAALTLLLAPGIHLSPAQDGVAGGGLLAQTTTGLHGRIVEADSGRPLSGVRIRASQGGSFLGGEALSGADGSFVLTGATGSVRVTFSRMGYRTETRDVVVTGTPLRVELSQSPLELDQMTVSATRAETRLADAPGSVSVISRAALDARNTRRIDNTLVYTPGVYNHRDNLLDDGHGSIHLRGIPGQRRTLIMVDGIPMNDGYNGNVRFGGFSPEDLERVEVVRGPSSSLYGGYAMAGVVNFVTRLPDSRVVRASLAHAPDVGGNGNALSRQWMANASLGDRVGRVAVLASYRRHATDGYAWDEVTKTPLTGAGSIPVTGFRAGENRTGATVYSLGTGGVRSVLEQSLAMKVAIDLMEDTRLTLGVTRLEGEHGHGAPEPWVRDASGNPVLGGSLIIQDGGAEHRVSLAPRDFLSSYGGKDHRIYSAALTSNGFGAESRLAVAWNDYESWYATYDASATYEGGSGRIVQNPSPSIVADFQSTTNLGPAHRVTGGFTVKRDEADLRETNLTNWRDTSTRSDLRYSAGGKVSTLGLFLQDEIRVREAVTLYLGLRWDRWTTHDGAANDVGAEGYPRSFEDRSSSFLSPRAALILRPGDDTQLKLSAGRGFRGPTVFELYRTWTLSTGRINWSNPELGPETIFSLDVGVQHRIEGLALGVALYRNDVRDMIHRMTLPDDNGIFENTGRVITQGIELQAEQRLGPGSRAFANYTYTDATIRENPAAPQTEGMMLTGVPPHLFNAGVELSQRSWTGGVHGRYVAKRFSTDTNVDTVQGVFGSADAFFLLNLRGAYRVGGVELSASLDNALDRRYFDFNLAPGRTLLLEAGFQVP